MKQGLTILMFHRILPLEQCVNYPLNSLVIPEEVFNKQVQWLSVHCCILPVQQALSRLAKQKTHKKPLVSITFDDGYLDNYQLAAPILKRHNVRGTFFITTGFIENNKPLWYDIAANDWRHLSGSQQCRLISSLAKELGVNAPKLPPSTQNWMSLLKQARPHLRGDILEETRQLIGNQINLELYRPMSRNQIKTLHNHGHEIASHTVSHPILTQLNEKELQQELTQSAQKISQWIGTHPNGFCYPNGDFNDTIANAVLEAGYKYSCTTETGLNTLDTNPATLNRLSITMQRTTTSAYSHDRLGFRSELCRLREYFR